MGQTPLAASWLFRGAPTAQPSASSQTLRLITPASANDVFVRAGRAFVNASSAFAGRSARVDFNNADRRQSSAIAEPRRRAVPAQTNLS
jgi:hypothetical protein